MDIAHPPGPGAAEDSAAPAGGGWGVQRMDPSRRRCPTCMTTDARRALLTSNRRPRLTRVVTDVRYDQLTAPTPCPEATVGDLLDHIDGLSLAFTAAARKERLEGNRDRLRRRLAARPTSWRIRIPRRLAALAAAWRDERPCTPGPDARRRRGPARRSGGGVALDEVMSTAGTSPSPVASRSAAPPGTCRPRTVSSGRAWRGTRRAAPACWAAGTRPGGRRDRLIGLTGRDPAWRAAAPATNKTPTSTTRSA